MILLLIEMVKNLGPLFIIGFLFILAYVLQRTKKGYYNQTLIGELNKLSPQPNNLKLRTVVFFRGEQWFIYKDRYLILAIPILFLYIILNIVLWEKTGLSLWLLLSFSPCYIVMPLPLFVVLEIITFKKSYV